MGALAVYDDGSGPALYAGGRFTTAGGIAANRVARWDGSAWSAFGGPAGAILNWPFVNALVVSAVGSRSALHVAGSFLTAGGFEANSVARWDGQTWSPLAGPCGTGVNGGTVGALAVFDDGRGEALFAGGGFLAAGGLPSGHIAAWRCSPEIFADDFEDGTTTAWSQTVP